MLPVSVILVNYHSPELVVGAVRHLETLDHERPAETIVVDNSSDRELQARLDGRVTYLTAQRNLGFAGGVNAGLARVTEEIVLLLNPDARPEPGCLDALATVLQESRDVGIAAPQLVPLSPGMATIPSATRRDPSLLTLLAEYTALRRLLPASWLLDRYFLTAEHCAAPCAAAMVQGACFAFRRSLVDRIGRFDEERFFLYWEETDFCRRARAAGWRVLYCPQARCGHAGGGSTPEPEAARRYFWWGLLAYYRKHEGAARTAFLRGALVCGTAIEVCLLTLLRLIRPTDRRLRHDLDENRRRLGHLLLARPPERRR